MDTDNSNGWQSVSTFCVLSVSVLYELIQFILATILLSG